MLSSPAKRRLAKGFTLVELLVTIGIVGVISLLALQGMFIYRDNAYHGVAMDMMAQTRVALEAGKIDGESWSSVLTFDQTSAGTASNGDGSTLLPGFSLPGDIRIYIRHDPACSTQLCIEDSLLVRHCKVDKQITVIGTYGGIGTYNDNVAASGSCS